MNVRLISYVAIAGVLAVIVGCAPLEQRPAGQDPQKAGPVARPDGYRLEDLPWEQHATVAYQAVDAMLTAKDGDRFLSAPR